MNKDLLDSIEKLDILKVEELLKVKRDNNGNIIHIDDISQIVESLKENPFNLIVQRGENTDLELKSRKEMLKILILSIREKNILNKLINYKDPEGYTPLLILSDKVMGCSEPDIAETLIENGADVNCVNKFGFTPLHYAVINTVKYDIKYELIQLKPNDIECNKSLKLIEVLLRKGANPNALDNSKDLRTSSKENTNVIGKTPYSWAKELKFSDSFLKIIDNLKKDNINIEIIDHEKQLELLDRIKSGDIKENLDMIKSQDAVYIDTLYNILLEYESIDKKIKKILIEKILELELSKDSISHDIKFIGLIRSKQCSIDNAFEIYKISSDIIRSKFSQLKDVNINKTLYLRMLFIQAFIFYDQYINYPRERIGGSLPNKEYRYIHQLIKDYIDNKITLEVLECEIKIKNKDYRKYRDSAMDYIGHISEYAARENIGVQEISKILNFQISDNTAQVCYNLLMKSLDTNISIRINRSGGLFKELKETVCTIM